MNFSETAEERIFFARGWEALERTHRISDASVFTHNSEFVRSKTHARRKTWRRVFLLVKPVGRDARQKQRDPRALLENSRVTYARQIRNFLAPSRADTQNERDLSRVPAEIKATESAIGDSRADSADSLM